MADYEKYSYTGKDDAYDGKAVSEPPHYPSSGTGIESAAPAGYDGEYWA